MVFRKEIIYALEGPGFWRESFRNAKNDPYLPTELFRLLNIPMCFLITSSMFWCIWTRRWVPRQKVSPLDMVFVQFTRICLITHSFWFVVEFAYTNVVQAFSALALHHVGSLFFMVAWCREPRALCFWITLTGCLHTLHELTQNIELLGLYNVALAIHSLTLYYYALKDKAISRTIPMLTFVVCVCNYFAYCSWYDGLGCIRTKANFSPSKTALERDYEIIQDAMAVVVPMIGRFVLYVERRFAKP